MKKLIFVLIALFAINGAFAQVKQFQGTFDEAKMAAKESGRILLVNCTSPGG